MVNSSVGAIGLRWRQRSRLNKLLIVGLVATAASLLPATGSFVPRDSGNLLFGDVAQAACKWNGKPGPGSLTNRAERWFGWAYVRTGWCYSGGHVTSRHSVPDFGVSTLGFLSGTRTWVFGWAYTDCHDYNGYWNHNCLTRGQFKWVKSCLGGGLCTQAVICIHTRIYGNGAHSRLITEGRCPAPNRLHW